MSLYNDFLFRKGFLDFFKQTQQEGTEAENLSPYKNIFPADVSAMYEKMIDFYIDLGFTPRAQYDSALKEREKLNHENSFLRETIKQLQLNIFAEGDEKTQEAWNSFVEKLIETNKEMAKNLFELFGQGSTDSYGKEMDESFNDNERRHGLRHKLLSPVEFVVHGADDKTLKGIILNFCDAGLCIYSFIRLNKGQEIIIKTSLPVRHQAFTVQWNNAYLTGLSA